MKNSTRLLSAAACAALLFAGTAQAQETPKNYWFLKAVPMLKPVASAPAQAQPTITLSDAVLPDGMQGKAYSFDLKTLTTVTGGPGIASAQYGLGSGTLPTGISLSSDGMLAGTPTAVTKSTPFSVAASYEGRTAQANFSLAILGPLAARCANGEQTCAIFIQADAHPYVRVDDPLLISTVGGAAPTTSAYASARANRSATTGKHYWEMTRTGSSVSGWWAFVCGLAPLNFDLAKLAGYEGAYGFSHPNAYMGSVYGCLLDLDAGTLSWTLNGVAQASVTVTKGVAYAPTPGLHSTDAYRFNFGQSAFTYTVPAGYRQGFY